ncbi:hypothetical protein ABUK73_19525 [Agrobacterium sp. BA1120]|uniref:hypothetical protein n=1 Tax=Agrobacterium sp. BA1120 TaxID=3228927 RepID=UPI003369F836
MTEKYGPYKQMGILAERMAAHYQTDATLELGPHLAHYMDEVQVNIAAHHFDHVGFMRKIDERLKATLAATSNPRRVEFLHAVTVALQDRMDAHPVVDH